MGDFILTLPAIALVRQAFDCHLEILGYPHIACLAEGRFYADAVRSVNQGGLAVFYAKNGELSSEMRDYFSGFQQVISYLYDPDGIFEENVRRCGVKNYVPAFRKVSTQHAAKEWARPLESLALYLEDHAARVHLNQSDLSEAAAWLGTQQVDRLVIHPGSGSPSKNWPVDGWISIARRFLERSPSAELVWVSGEADQQVLKAVKTSQLSQDPRVRFAHELPLPLLAAVLALCGKFAGHDTGVAHLAAAVGAQSVLLFGPTDPELWAPKNQGVKVLKAPQADWSRLSPGAVWASVEKLFLA